MIYFNYLVVIGSKHIYIKFCCTKSTNSRWRLFIYRSGISTNRQNCSDRNFLTPVFTSESGSDDFVSPLEIPYIFRNDGGDVTDVFTFDSSSGQIYNVSSVSSSTDINNTFIYGNIHFSTTRICSFSGSLHSSISTQETDNIINEYVNLTFKQHDFQSGSIVVSLLTDSGSLTLPTDTGSVEYHIEGFVSESGYLSGNTIWRNSICI